MSDANGSLAIEARGLCYTFGGQWRLQGLDLAVESGQVFGLLGANGAGKTTTIRLLTGQLQPESGTVRILGLDPVQEAKRVRSIIGIMAEEPGHYGNLSVRTNLRFFASLYGASASVVDEILEKVGLSFKASEAVAQLSHGMRQRLALARALVGHPQVLFLDEPTSGLDPIAARGVHGLITDFCAGGGTVFLTTHYLGEAESLCHKVAIVQDGSVLCCGHYVDLCRQYLPSEVEVVQGGRVIKRAPGLEELFCHLTGSSIN